MLIQSIQTVFAFCYCAELVILYDRAGGEGSQGKTLDLRWQKKLWVCEGCFEIEGTVKNQVAYEADSR